MESGGAGFDRWFEPSQVEELSHSLGEPAAETRLRQDALQSFRELPFEPSPLYRKYVYLSGVNLSAASPLVRGPPVGLPAGTPTVLRVVHDASGTRVELPEELRAAGVTAEALPAVAGSLDGRYAGFLEGLDPKGPRSDKLEALSVALMNRGVDLTVPDDCPVPVHVQDLTVFSRPNEILSVRRRIRAGRHAQVVASEEVYSTPAEGGQRFYGSLASVQTGDEARVAYLTVHAPDARLFSAYSRHAVTGRATQLAWVWAGLGGFRTRSRNFSDVAGNGGDVADLQAFYGDGQQSFDSYVQITHQGTDTHGQSITRGIFRDEARGVSRGLARIEKEARKTVSYLSEHAMLLSRQARSDTIPVLEILCRDVKATHSSSVAPVDPERVFYLESRGIPAPDAVRMISEGFLGYVLDRAPIADLAGRLAPHLAARWERRPIVWADGAYPVLAPLEVLGAEGAKEWRFDTKLR